MISDTKFSRQAVQEIVEYQCNTCDHRHKARLDAQHCCKSDEASEAIIKRIYDGEEIYLKFQKNGSLFKVKFTDELGHRYDTKREVGVRSYSAKDPVSAPLTVVFANDLSRNYEEISKKEWEEAALQSCKEHITYHEAMIASFTRVVQKMET